MAIVINKTATQVWHDQYEQQRVDFYTGYEIVEDILNPDQQQLHYNIRALIRHQGVLLPRGSGRTTAILYMMLRELKVINYRHRYLCVSSTHAAVQHTIQLFKYLCAYNAVECLQSFTNTLKQPGKEKRVHFITRDELIEDRILREMERIDKIWLDLSGDDFTRQFEVIHYPDTMLDIELHSLGRQQPPVQLIKNRLDMISHENTRLYY